MGSGGPVPNEPLTSIALRGDAEAYSGGTEYVYILWAMVHKGIILLSLFNYSV